MNWPLISQITEPSLFGGLDSGLDCGTGLWDWTVGVDSEKVVLIISGD